MVDSDPMPFLAFSAIFKKIMSHDQTNEFLKSAGIGNDDISELHKLAEDDSIVIFSIAKVVARQRRKTIKAKEWLDPDTAAATVKLIDELLGTLPGRTCSVCGLNGHEPAYCWLNGQMYGAARSRGPAYQSANLAWREALRTRQAATLEYARS